MDTEGEEFLRDSEEDECFRCLLPTRLEVDGSVCRLLKFGCLSSVPPAAQQQQLFISGLLLLPLAA